MTSPFNDIINTAIIKITKLQLSLSVKIIGHFHLLNQIQICCQYKPTARYVYLNRPVKIHLDIDTNMKMVGKRFPYYASYKVNYYPLLYSVIVLVM